LVRPRRARARWLGEASPGSAHCVLSRLDPCPALPNPNGATSARKRLAATESGREHLDFLPTHPPGEMSKCGQLHGAPPVYT
jgi:hypothetical protein